MRILSGLVVWALVASIEPASAADHPALFATRDAEVRYRVVTGDQAAPAIVTVQLSAAARVARVNSPKLDGFLLVDPRLDRVTVVLPSRHAYSELPLGPDTERFMLLGPSMSFVAGQDASIAGQPCREWTVSSAKGVGKACVTVDGLLLRASGNLGGDPSNTIEAVSVDYGAQPAALFAMPAGLHRVTPSSG